MKSYLDDIVDRKRKELKQRSDSVDLAALQKRATRCDTDVLGALRRTDRLAIIAEHKRKSPSQGFIKADSDPAAIGRGYEAAGASAMSVLTDEAGFGGTLADLEAAHDAIGIPVLCKDFVITPLQVFEARAAGADLVLLIVAALDKKELKSLHRLIGDLGMTALVEVHDAHELDVAASVGARLIGVNNRNLHTFEIDLAVSRDLVERFPKNAVKVSESGLSTPAQLRSVQDWGYDAALIGTSLMGKDDPGAALSALIATLTRP